MRLPFRVTSSEATAAQQINESVSRRAEKTSNTELTSSGISSMEQME